MIGIDPAPVVGDVACTRASPKWVFDRAGALVQVPANTLAVTYDPVDLSKAPYALVEPAATNLFLGSQAFNTGYWSTPNTTVTPNAAVAPDGTNTASRFDFLSGSCYVGQSLGSVVGAYTFSVFVSTSDRCLFVGGGGSYTDTFEAVPLPNGWFRQIVRFNMISGNLVPIFSPLLAPPLSIFAWGAQIVAGSDPGSYIPTAGAPVTRAADIIAPGAGLVYSNVPIAEPAYNAGTTYAQNAVVYDPATFTVYQSLIANNVGKALADTTAWTPRGATNRWGMFDMYTGTQTSNAEEIVVVVSAQAVARGIFLGNIDASEVRFSTVDLTEGVVYRETQSRVTSNSKSSWYRWFFERIRRKKYAVSVLLPPYANALITIAIKRPGGTAKCGVAVVGPVIDVGLSQYGLGREIKDWSTVDFNFDGTSSTTERGYSKVMDVDVVIANDQVDDVIDILEEFRQRPIAWIGSVMFGSACLFGKYESFKNVVDTLPQSKMNLRIQGTV